MTGRRIPLETWSRADQFRLFRGYDRPHYAITSRVDVSALMRARQDSGLSPFRTCLWAIGAGLHAVPALRTRFRGDEVTEFDRVQLSPTIGMPSGEFRYTYLDWDPDRAAFDVQAAAKIDAVRAGGPLDANEGEKLDVAYLSCMPWLDYSALDNALPGPEDCIPRVSWGRIVPTARGHDMAMTIQVHHAVVDGRQVGDFFAATADALADPT